MREKAFTNWNIRIKQRNICRLLAHTVYCPLSVQTIVEKTFADRYKTAKFAKSLSLESFPLHNINYCNESGTGLQSILVYIYTMYVG